MCWHRSYPLATLAWKPYNRNLLPFKVALERCLNVWNDYKSGQAFLSSFDVCPQLTPTSTWYYAIPKPQNICYPPSLCHVILQNPAEPQRQYYHLIGQRQRATLLRLSAVPWEASRYSMVTFTDCFVVVGQTSLDVSRLSATYVGCGSVARSAFNVPDVKRGGPPNVYEAYQETYQLRHRAVSTVLVFSVDSSVVEVFRSWDYCGRQGNSLSDASLCRSQFLLELLEQLCCYVKLVATN